MSQESEKVTKALELILQYGGIDGAHHKDWVLDQVVRVLTEDGYEKFPNTYGWEEGIAP